MLLIIPGFIMAMIGAVMFIVAAFRVSVGWGIACLVLQPAQYIFMFSHWEDVSKAFWIQLSGVGLVVLGFFVGFPIPANGKFGSDAEAVQGTFEDATETAAETVAGGDESDAYVETFLGKTEIDVRKELGNPPRVLKNGDEVYWWYESRQITFKDGVVTEDGAEE
ncbi:MAG: hypothetical protein O2923_09745 [Verrucomicrobia bacterium]|nr:hypothetical protein [Verrucomicrobiota bacterium]